MSPTPFDPCRRRKVAPLNRRSLPQSINSLALLGSRNSRSVVPLLCMTLNTPPKSTYPATLPTLVLSLKVPARGHQLIPGHSPRSSQATRGAPPIYNTPVKPRAHLSSYFPCNKVASTSYVQVEIAGVQASSPFHTHTTTTTTIFDRDHTPKSKGVPGKSEKERQEKRPFFLHLLPPHTLFRCFYCHRHSRELGSVSVYRLLLVLFVALLFERLLCLTSKPAFSVPRISHARRRGRET